MSNESDSHRKYFGHLSPAHAAHDLPERLGEGHESDDPVDELVVLLGELLLEDGKMDPAAGGEADLHVLACASNVIW